MKKTGRKVISALLVLCLLFSAVPLLGGVFAETVAAADNGTLEGADGYGLGNVQFAQKKADDSEPQEPVPDPVQAPINVQRVDDLSEDFIHGVDVSSYLSVVQSGAKFYDEDGKEQNLFKIMSDAGINWVRLRVWNCPFPLDEDGQYKYVGADGVTEYKADQIETETRNENGFKEYFLADGTQVYRQVYGAGICDLDTAVQIGKLAKQYGMRVLIDFHYSDFWADPKKQAVPKQWEGMKLEEKKTALGKFTEESLTKLLEEGVDVGMVQVGNEINNGMAGESDFANVCELLKAGSAAVRKVSKEQGHEIMVAVHFTDPQSEGYQLGKAKELHDKGVDYDVFGTSYYPFWHGSPDQLTDSLKAIADTYNKKVMVAEISYAWTLEDGDGYANVVSGEDSSLELDYAIDPNGEGQAAAIRDAIAAVSAIGENGLGTFYWEPAWIPANVYDAEAEDADSALAANEKAWKLYGAGWGSIFAKEFDPEMAEDEKGGGTWDNQAYFDFEGHVLPSINVYKWVYTGAVGPVKVSTVSKASCTMNYGETPQLPAAVTVSLNNGETVQAAVTWKAEDIEMLKTADFGEYTISGSVNEFSYQDENGALKTEKAGTYQTSCTVTVTGQNYVVNGSFEDGDAGWELTNHAGEDVGWPQPEKNSSNAKSGSYYYKLWDEQPVDMQIDQTISSELPDGCYTLFAYYQGTGVGEIKDDTALYAVITYQDGTSKTLRSGIEIHNVWKDFYQARVSDIRIDDTVKSVRVGTRIAASPDKTSSLWITIDDVSLMRTGDLPKDDGKDDPSNTPSENIPSGNQPSGGQVSSGNSAAMEPEKISDAAAKITDAVQKSETTGKKTSVTIDMKNSDGTYASIAAKELLQTVKGKDVDVVLQMDGYSWTINGKNVTAAKDVDLAVTLNTKEIPQAKIDALMDGKKDTAIQLSLAYDGEFGFTAYLNLPLEKQYAGQFGNLYYYDKTGKLVWEASAKISTDGTISLPFQHASDYVIVIGENRAPETGDIETGALWLLLIASAGCIAAAGLRRRYSVR